MLVEHAQRLVEVQVGDRRVDRASAGDQHVVDLRR